MKSKKTELAPASSWETTTIKTENAAIYYEVKRRLVGELTEKRGAQLVGRVVKSTVQCFLVIWLACQQAQAAAPTPPIVILTNRSISENHIEDEKIMFIFSETQIILQTCEDGDFMVIRVEKHRFDGLFHTYKTPNGTYLLTPNGEVIHKLGEGKKEYITSTSEKP